MILTWPSASWHTDGNENKRNIRQARWGGGEREEGCSGGAGWNGKMVLMEERKGEKKTKEKNIDIGARRRSVKLLHLSVHTDVNLHFPRLGRMARVLCVRLFDCPLDCNSNTLGACLES